MWLFTALVIGHVVAGTTILISFWVPILSAKGGANHRRWGNVFSMSLFVAAWLAIAMAILNLTTASDRHPILADRALFNGLFGWMMLYLGMLTLGLGRYGLEAARHRGKVAANRTPINLAVQVGVIIAAINCAWQGYQLSQPLMVGLALLGFGAASSFIFALLAPTSSRSNYVREHLKAMVGAGISAYTAFLSVGLLQIVPQYVFNPAIWAIPSTVGIGLILYNFRKV